MKTWVQRIKNTKLDPTLETGLIWSGLGMVVFVLYYPIIAGSFLVDDYAYLVHLLGNARQYIQGEELGKWFLGYNGIVFLRPGIQWLWLTNFAAWHTNASGYYLTSIILHALNACLVYAIAKRVIRNTWGAVAAGLLFALHPIHADSVAWISDQVDLLCAFFGLLSTFFFVRFREHSSKRHFAISAVAFILAALTKESALTLPLIFFVYDLLFVFAHQRWRIVKAELMGVGLLLGYFLLRFWLFHGLGGYNGLGFMNYGWELFAQFYTSLLAKPFVADMNRELLLCIFLFLIAVLWVYRKHLGLWWGVAWIVLALLPAGTAYVALRLVYIPSIGLALAEGAILANPIPINPRASRWGSVVLAGILVSAYVWNASVQASNWAAAGQVASSIPAGTKKLFPEFPENSRVFFTGVPQSVRGVDVFAGNFPFAMRAAYYQNPYFGVVSSDRFPIITDGLTQSYFLEYRKRVVLERKDVREVLLARQRCLGASSVEIEWNFAKDVQGWEAWNDLADFESRDNQLMSRALGNDPYMASPLFRIPAMDIADIEITMRVRSDKPALGGAVYWRVAGALDFSPLFFERFDVNADSAFHTYRINISRGEKLFLDDQIEQLRLDPTDAPADIEIKAIRITGYCSSIQENICQCGK